MHTTQASALFNEDQTVCLSICIAISCGSREWLRWVEMYCMPIQCSTGICRIVRIRIAGLRAAQRRRLAWHAGSEHSPYSASACSTSS